MLETAIESGICSMGVDVWLVGPLPTPAIAFLTRSMRADAGVVISASHNPFQDNGIKFFSREGFKLDDETERRIEELVFDDGEIANHRAGADDIGKATRIDDALGRYLVFLKNCLPRTVVLDGLRVAIDCANGAAYKVGPDALEELGADVVAIAVEPDGKNINLNCGAVHLDLIRETVVREHANVGIGLEVALRDAGVRLVRTEVGDPAVAREMRQNSYNLGGEQSGHVIFMDHSTTGDGLISALMVLAMLAESGRPLSELRAMHRVPQVLENVRVIKRIPLTEMPEVQRIIADAQRRLADTGRLLVRYSGTEMLARVMVEGEDA